MKLRDKFKKQLDTATPKLNRPHFQAQQCEKIADDYVIKVLDSIREYEKESGNAICDDERDSRELLEIFKKEKGL
jgi:hypothetical protein